MPSRQLMDLTSELPLRTLDALHLAYARHYGVRSFATADKNQAEAAKAPGIPVIAFLLNPRHDRTVLPSTRRK